MTRVYHVDRESPAEAQPAPPVLPQATPQQTDVPAIAAPPPAAPLHYQAPTSWQAKPLTQMRVASLTAPGPNGASSDVSVIPLPVVGRDQDLVNLWRSQVNLPETSDPKAIRQARAVAIGADEGRLFSFVSREPMIGKSREQILVAMVARGSTTWFFRIVGPDELVNAQKNTFLEFLKSVSFTDTATDPTAGALPDAGASAATAPSIWIVPPGWQAVPPARFLFAEYSISGDGGAQARVNVAKLKGEGGGLPANANRWRGQIGLGLLDEGDLSKHVQPLAVPGGEAELVDFTGVDATTGAPARLVGARVERDGQAWFYKLMGDPQLVAREKNAFTAFIQSAHYANAR